MDMDSRFTAQCSADQKTMGAVRLADFVCNSRARTYFWTNNSTFLNDERMLQTNTTELRSEVQMRPT